MSLSFRASVVLGIASVMLPGCRTTSNDAGVKDAAPGTDAQSAPAMPASGSVTPAETCAFTIGGQPFLNTSLGVLGPDRYASSLVLLGMNGGPNQTLTVAPATALAGELARFQLDASGTSAFDTLIFFTPTPTDTVLRAQILMRPNAVSAVLQGTCQFSDK